MRGSFSFIQTSWYVSFTCKQQLNVSVDLFERAHFLWIRSRWSFICWSSIIKQKGRKLNWKMQKQYSWHVKVTQCSPFQMKPPAKKNTRKMSWTRQFRWLILIQDNEYDILSKVYIVDIVPALMQLRSSINMLTLNFGIAQFALCISRVSRYTHPDKIKEIDCNG